MTEAEARDEARRLVVAEGHSYAEASAATGIPVSTLQKLGAREEWQKQRSTAMSYTAQVRAMKANLLAQIIAVGADPAKAQLVVQLTHAWRGMETAYPEHRYDKKSDPKVKLQVGAELLQVLVEFLAGRDRNALAALEPHIQPFAAAWEDHVAAA